MYYAFKCKHRDIEPTSLTILALSGLQKWVPSLRSIGGRPATSPRVLWWNGQNATKHLTSEHEPSLETALDV